MLRHKRIRCLVYLADKLKKFLDLRYQHTPNAAEMTIIRCRRLALWSDV